MSDQPGYSQSGQPGDDRPGSNQPGYDQSAYDQSGQGRPGYDQTGYGSNRPLGSGMAIAALVLGILALITFWTVIGGILLGLIAIVLGIIAVRRASRGLAAGRGMAIAGIVLGVIGLLLSVAFVAFGISIFNSSGGKTYTSCVQNANGDQAKVQKCAEEFQRNLQN